MNYRCSNDNDFFLQIFGVTLFFISLSNIVCLNITIKNDIEEPELNVLLLLTGDFDIANYLKKVILKN